MTGKLKDLMAEDIMTEPVETVYLHQSLGDIIQHFLDKKFSGAPVCDPSGKLLSVITESDLMQLAVKNPLDSPLKLFQNELVPKKKVIAVRRLDPFVEVFRQFLIRPVRRVIVIDSTDKVIGIISRRNILRAFMDTRGQEE